MNKTTDWLNRFKASHRAKKIAFVSGKGGVGKTSCCLKLAKAIGDLKYKVLVVDCDYNLSNTLIKLGENSSDQFTRYLNKEISLRQTIRTVGQIDVLATANGSFEIFENIHCVELKIISAIEKLSPEYDFIFMDCAAGIEKENLNLASYCDERVIIVTPDRSSLTDAYSLLKILVKRYEVLENSFLLNKIESFKMYQSFKGAIDTTSSKFLQKTFPFLGYFSHVNLQGDRFNQTFLNKENSSLYQECDQIINKLIDRDCAFRSSFSESTLRKPFSFEEVR
jgi:flagellar biosynthesis protein FlhG